MINHRKTIYFILLLLPFLIICISIFIGRYPLKIDTVIGVLGNQLFHLNADVTPIEKSVVWDVRLPRTLSGIAIGTALAVSGAALQGLFKNPLVDAGILGVSSGAGFGAVLSIILFSHVNAITFVFAFIFGMVAVFLSTMIAKIYKNTPTIMLVLGGVIVSSVFSALISLGKYMADPFNELPAITFWLMGSLANSNYHDLSIAMIPMSIGIIGIFIMRWRINIMAMGEIDAQTLGVNLKLSRTVLIIFTTLATAGAVSISGTIGWIGLIIPHISRMIGGNDNKILIPISISLGAFFLVLIDILSRTLTGAEIPLGVITALVGAPFYVYILKMTKGGGW